MTPQERERLDAVLQHRGVKHTDLYIAHVNADYAAITQGDDTMTEKDHTVKELIELITQTSRHYQMSKSEAEKLANAKSAPAWASRYAEQVLTEIEEDERRQESYTDR